MAANYRDWHPVFDPILSEIEGVMVYARREKDGSISFPAEQHRRLEDALRDLRVAVAQITDPVRV